MKRSELIERLYNYESNDYIRFPDHYDGDPRVLIDMIVAGAEKLGMLAPYRKKTEEEREKIDAINQYGYCHRWEKE